MSDYLFVNTFKYVTQRFRFIHGKEVDVLKNPLLKIYCDPIYENTRKITQHAKNSGVCVWGVTKGLCGSPELAKLFIEGGCAGLADSRLDNIIKQKKMGIKAKYMLIRIPMIVSYQERCKYKAFQSLQTLKNNI